VPSTGRLWAELAAGRAAECKYKRLAKDGSPVWFANQPHPVLDAAGKVAGALLAASDCTAQQKLAQEVAELRVRSEMTNLTSIVSESDLKGDILEHQREVHRGFQIQPRGADRPSP
jgi:methyl-accepting chemotaxis protein